MASSHEPFISWGQTEGDKRYLVQETVAFRGDLTAKRLDGLPGLIQRNIAIGDIKVREDIVRRLTPRPKASKRLQSCLVAFLLIFPKALVVVLERQITLVVAVVLPAKHGARHHDDGRRQADQPVPVGLDEIETPPQQDHETVRLTDIFS